jgi:hypothetical protein
MLVLEESESLRLITQHDHARLAHELLALWTADGFPQHHLRDDLLLATAEHDCGWQGPDAAPMLDLGKKLPFDFKTYPADERQYLWRETIHRLSETNLRAVLLVIRHAERIHQERLSEPGWQGFLAELAETRQSLEASNAISSAELDGAYEYLWMADIVSLGACGALGTTILDWSGYEFSISPAHIKVRPFPYAGPLTLRVACRLLPECRYSSAADFASDLASARWQFMPIRVEAE